MRIFFRPLSFFDVVGALCALGESSAQIALVVPLSFLAGVVLGVSHHRNKGTGHGYQNNHIFLNVQWLHVIHLLGRKMLSEEVNAFLIYPHLHLVFSDLLPCLESPQQCTQRKILCQPHYYLCETSPVVLPHL